MRDASAQSLFAEGTRLMQVAIACIGVGLIVSGLLDGRKRKKNGQPLGVGAIGQIIVGAGLLIFCLFVPWLVAP